MGVPPRRGIPLLPLQDYFVSGLSVIVDPGTLQILAIVALLIGAILAVPRLARVAAEAIQRELGDDADAQAPAGPVPGDEPKPPEPASTPAPSRVRGVVEKAGSVVTNLVFGATVLATVLLVPLAYWAPGLAALLVGLLVVQAHRRYRAFPSSRSTAGRAQTPGSPPEGWA